MVWVWVWAGCGCDSGGGGGVHADPDTSKGRRFKTRWRQSELARRRQDMSRVSTPSQGHIEGTPERSVGGALAAL